MNDEVVENPWAPPSTAPSTAPSTRNLKPIVEPEALQRVLRAAAVLDMIICDDWQGRYYSYNAKWSPGEEMASMRNGSGDDFHVVFSVHGVVIKGCMHEYPARVKTHPAILSELVGPLRTTIEDVAFDLDHASFCIWRGVSDNTWKIGPIDHEDESQGDGSAWGLTLFDGRPESYHEWAEDYFDDEEGELREFPLAAIRRVYAFELLTQELVSAINPDRRLADMREELIETGYPVSEK